MKVALCLSGHMRTYEQTYDYWRRFLFDKYETDVFIHTWDENDRFGPEGKISINHIRDCFHSGPNQTIEIVAETYEDKKNIFYEMAKPAWEWLETIDKKYPEESLEKFLSQLYKWWQVNKLKRMKEIREAFRYNMVIRSRPDLRPTDRFNIPIRPKNSNEVFVAPGGPSEYWVNDVLIASTSENMDKINNLFILFEKRFEMCKEMEKPEYIFDMHMQVGHFLKVECGFQVNPNSVPVKSGWQSLIR